MKKDNTVFCLNFFLTVPKFFVEGTFGVCEYLLVFGVDYTCMLKNVTL